MAIRSYQFITGPESSIPPDVATPQEEYDLLTLGYADANYVKLNTTPSFAGATFNDPIVISQETTPSSPSSGFVKIYSKSDDQLYLLDSSGFEIAFGNPAGTILSFAGSTAPTGYLVCDGSTVSRSSYANLYSVIGDSFGEGDGSTTFHLPDLRGRFLRGWDNSATNDPDAASRTASNTGGNTGDNIGSLQDHQLDSHNHSTNTTGAHVHTTNFAQTSWKVGTGSTFYNIDSSGGTVSTRSSGAASNGNHSHTITSAGGNETRPVNVAVNYIIKF